MKIEVQNIRKTFGGFAALDRVSLDVPSGELSRCWAFRARARRPCCASSPGSTWPDSGKMRFRWRGCTLGQVRPPAPCRLRVPALRPVPPYDRVRERRLRLARKTPTGAAARSRNPPACRNNCWNLCSSAGSPGPIPCPALRRPAAAHRACACARDRAACALARRALRLARCQSAQGTAPLAAQPPRPRSTSPRSS